MAMIGMTGFLLVGTILIFTFYVLPTNSAHVRVRHRVRQANHVESMVLGPVESEDEEKTEDEDFRELAERVAHRVLVTKAGMPNTFRAEIQKYDEEAKFHHVDDPKAVFDGIRKRMGTLGRTNGGRANFAAHDGEQASSWGADLSRERSQLSSIGDSLNDALRSNVDPVMEVAELEAQIASYKEQLKEKLTKKHDPAPDVPFDGGLSVFFEDQNGKDGKKWGEGDKHVVGVALKQEYDHGPLVCLCKIACAESKGSTLGPVLGTTCCQCLNQPLSNILPELSEGTLAVEGEVTTTPMPSGDDEVEEESGEEEKSEGKNTAAGRRLRMLIEGALKPGLTYDLKNGPISEDDENKTLVMGNPPPWLVKDLVAWGTSIRNNEEGEEEEEEEESATGATGIEEEEQLSCAELELNDGSTTIYRPCRCGIAMVLCPEGFFCCTEAGGCADKERFGECTSSPISSIATPPTTEPPTTEASAGEDEVHSTLAKWMSKKAGLNQKVTSEIIDDAKDSVHLAADVVKAGHSHVSNVLKRQLDNIAKAVGLESPKPGSIIKKMKEKSSLRVKGTLGDASEISILGNDSSLQHSVADMTSILDSIEKSRIDTKNDTSSETFALQELSSLAESNAKAASKIAALAGQNRLDALRNISRAADTYISSLSASPKPNKTNPRDN